MFYIKITNQADEVSRLKLEKLGFSTKRNDETTIGQFGSGIKFAPISAIRKGIDFIFAGNDSKGAYTLQYIIQEDEGIDSVFYKYDDYIKPSSFTADAGTLSWETDFQIYREVIANAMDEAKISNTEWTMEVVNVDKIVPVEGEFSVYLGATESMLELHNDFDKYFSCDREPIYSDSLGVKLYLPIDDTFRVYCKGVLVYSSKHRSDRFGGEILAGLFDYEFDFLKLNEERTVSSEYEMNNAIMTTLAKLTDESLISGLLDTFIDQYEDHDAYYELQCIPSYTYKTGQYNDDWANVFEKKYPNTVVVPEDALTINLSATIATRGYTHVSIHHDGIYEFLTGCGIKPYISIFNNGFVYDYTMDISESSKLLNAIEIVSYSFPEYSYDSSFVGIYEQSDEADVEALGMTLKIRLNDDDENDTKVMLINRDHINDSDMESLVATLVHEWDHFTTSIGDGNIEGRMFRDVADKKIGKLIMNAWWSK